MKIRIHDSSVYWMTNTSDASLQNIKTSNSYIGENVVWAIMERKSLLILQIGWNVPNPNKTPGERPKEESFVNESQDVRSPYWGWFASMTLLIISIGFYFIFKYGFMHVKSIKTKLIEERV